MNRKTDIDRLVRSAREDLQVIQNNLLTRTQKTSFDRIKTKIKSVLEHLRSALDYAVHDIAQLAPAGALPKKIYFPYIHPIDKLGNQKTSAGIIHEFAKESQYGYLHQHIAKINAPLYKELEAVQGQQWLSDLIEAVNSQKHQSLVKLGEPQIHDGSGLVLLGEGSAFIADSGATVRIDGQRIQTPFEVRVGSSIPQELAAIFYETEEIEESRFKMEWVDRLKDWTDKTESLLNTLYRHIH